VTKQSVLIVIPANAGIQGMGVGILCSPRSDCFAFRLRPNGLAKTHRKHSCDTRQNLRLNEREYALAAAKAGADFLGMVLHPAPRQISVEERTLWSKPCAVKRPDLRWSAFLLTSRPKRSIALQSYVNWIMVQLSGGESWNTAVRQRSRSSRSSYRLRSEVR